MVPEHLREALIKAVKPLEDIPSKEKDWHPESNEQVLDLVHPSLYPLVFGQTRILPAGIVGLSDCLDSYGQGEVVAEPSYEEVDKDIEETNCRVWSESFQWLPSNFEIPQDSDEVKYDKFRASSERKQKLTSERRLSSYINGLHPEKHGDLHRIIEQFVGKAIPLVGVFRAIFSLLDLHACPRHVVGASRPKDYPNLAILTRKPSTVGCDVWCPYGRQSAENRDRRYMLWRNSRRRRSLL